MTTLQPQNSFIRGRDGIVLSDCHEDFILNNGSTGAGEFLEKNFGNLCQCTDTAQEFRPHLADYESLYETKECAGCSDCNGSGCPCPPAERGSNHGNFTYICAAAYEQGAG